MRLCKSELDLRLVGSIVDSVKNTTMLGREEYSVHSANLVTFEFMRRRQVVKIAKTVFQGWMMTPFRCKFGYELAYRLTSTLSAE